MDLRRPSRPPPSSRRNIFHAPSSRRPNPSNMSTSSLSTLHIPAEEADPKDDLVERDSSGTYVMAAPATNSRPGHVLRTEVDDEIEQENQVIALLGQQNATTQWEQATIMHDIKSALESSLERKVQSLEHDRWMFGGDGKSKG